MIEVSNLAKIYPNQRGIKGISFNVAKGEIVGLLGPNGAGKTTTMRVMTGYLYPTGGTVKVGDYDIYDDPREVRRQIGYLPENPPLYPEMSVEGYLRFAARLKGVKKVNVSREVDRVINLTVLGDVKKQLIGSLSKGYKQRVGLAQALLNSPPVLVLDEPTSGLDPKQIIEIRNLIKNLAKEHTILLSSHILPEVNMICGRVAIIDQGRLVAVDTPDGLAQKLTSGQKIEVEAKGQREEMEKILQSVKGVQNISYLGLRKDRAGNESHSFEVESQLEGDIREQLFKSFAGSKVPLLELHSINLSLEDIFLQLTTTESMEAPTGQNLTARKTTGAGKVGVANE